MIGEYNINEYKNKITNEIQRLTDHLNDLTTLFEFRFCIESYVTPIEDPFSESEERDKLAWCYENDIPCIISIVKTNDSFRPGMQEKMWRVFEFKNKADMVAFKLKFNDSNGM